MSIWTVEDFYRIGASEELRLASGRPDGSLRGFVTMWVVRVGDDVFVRSAGGPDRPWFRHALSAGNGVIRAGGIQCPVAFAAADPGVHDAIDAAYHAKYDRYGPRIVGSVVGPDAHQVTIRLVPAQSEG